MLCILLDLITKLSGLARAVNILQQVVLVQMLLSNLLGWLQNLFLFGFLRLGLRAISSLANLSAFSC